MPPQRRLKACERLKLKGHTDSGQSIKDAANALDILYSTARYNFKRQPLRDLDQNDLSRSGRPRITSYEYDTRLYRRAKRSSMIYWSEFLEEEPLSRKTAMRRFHELDFDFKKRPRRWRPYISAEDALKRRKYERYYRCWRAEDWANIWFIDECSIEIGKGEMCKWAWMYFGE